MVTIVCSSQYPLGDFKEHVVKTSGLHDKVEFLYYENKNEFSLTEIYNRGLKEAKNNIIVFLHRDISIETKQWGNKLVKLFDKNPEYGIIGVAGSKNMPASGQWWENRSKMYGRVAHTHEGKTWLSAYSDDLGQNLEEVVVVDGVWFAVDKKRLKKDFNENVEGFHFYDVTFAFENFLEGVKVGVTTVVRVNHQSIGMTNEAWEKNRADFSESFKANLPANIKKTLRKNQKLKILIGCLSYTNFTGSELYVFELAKQLKKLGHDVSICSSIGEPLLSVSHKLGIKMYNIQEPPGYKLGDGKWMLNTPNGTVPSALNTLYKIQDINFDIIHLNHKPVTEHLLRFYPETPTICSIHSEVISLEEPVISPQIKSYIAIRPEIKEYIVNKFGIDESLVSVIYNPIDETRFKPIVNSEKRDKKRILFVGTIDYLRQQTIADLINTTRENNQELWIVGKKNDTYLDSLIAGQEHVKYFEPTSNVEKFIHQCDETAGILLGRTTIEGWMCGKNGWIYNINETGQIINKSLHVVPEDLDKFKSGNVVNEIIKEYIKIL
jgi:glycosyltransferase involved in cell wall biosynthesis